MAQIRQCWDTIVVQRRGMPMQEFLARRLIDQGFAFTEKRKCFVQFCNFGLMTKFHAQFLDLTQVRMSGNMF